MNWATGKIEAHRLDANLSTVRQEEARSAISTALREYNVGAVDTLIDDIVPPDELMKTLTDRKIAEQERVTYEPQRQAQEVKQQLEQATALAATQAKVVDAERQVAIAQFNAEAGVRSAEGLARAKKINAEADAQAKKINAEADATVLRSVGDAEAAKTNAVGSAEAAVIKLKIASMESGNYAIGSGGRGTRQVRCQTGAGHRCRWRQWRWYVSGCAVGECDPRRAAAAGAGRQPELARRRARWQSERPHSGHTRSTSPADGRTRSGRAVYVASAGGRGTYGPRRVCHQTHREHRS